MAQDDDGAGLGFLDLIDLARGPGEEGLVAGVSRGHSIFGFEEVAIGGAEASGCGGCGGELCEELEATPVISGLDGEGAQEEALCFGVVAAVFEEELREELEVSPGEVGIGLGDEEEVDALIGGGLIAEEVEVCGGEGGAEGWGCEVEGAAEVLEGALGALSCAVEGEEVEVEVARWDPEAQESGRVIGVEGLEAIGAGVEAPGGFGEEGAPLGAGEEGDRGVVAGEAQGEGEGEEGVEIEEEEGESEECAEGAEREEGEGRCALKVGHGVGVSLDRGLEVAYTLGPVRKGVRAMAPGTRGVVKGQSAHPVVWRTLQIRGWAAWRPSLRAL